MIRIGIDIGGTFTDFVAYDEVENSVLTTKVPTTPHAPEEGCIHVFNEAGIETDAVSRLIHGTTLVTNLLLERSGGRIGLLTTEGFRDVLEIGRADREKPYDPLWTRAAPLVPRYLRLEIRERLNPDGSISIELDEKHARRVIRELVNKEVDAIAVALVHAYANPQHERALQDMIREEAPHLPVSISSEVCPQIREYERTSTTVVNAYAIPKLRDYAGRLETAFQGIPIWYLTAAGQLFPPQTAADFPAQLCLSGPAGGVLAGLHLAEQLGLEDIITMDMGGTSCDVCLIQGGRVSSVPSVEVEWGIPIQVDAMAINTVGAGGGSIGWVDRGGALRVGPRSAGAIPGPACYGRGGEEPTITDANLALGILNPETFLGGRVQIDSEFAWKSLRQLAAALDVEADVTLAAGMHRIANAGMAQAIREITVQKGIDPRDSTLIAFGGAGGQHAAEVARELGITRVLFPVNASVLSAFGMVTADLGVSRTRSLMRKLDSSGLSLVREMLASMHGEALAQLNLDISKQPSEIEAIGQLDLRYTRQSHEITIPVNDDDTTADIVDRFEGRHYDLFGTRLGGAVDIVSVRLTLRSPTKKPALARMDEVAHGEATVNRQRYVGLVETEVAIFDRQMLAPGTQISGPCIIEEDDSTIFLPPTSEATVDQYGNIPAKINPIE